MFLITRLEGTSDVHELLALLPGDRLDSLRRIRRLVGLGIVEVAGTPPPDWDRAAPVQAAPALVSVPLVDDFDEDAMTLRPPSAKKAASVDGMTTKPPRRDAGDDRPTVPPIYDREQQIRAGLPEMTISQVLAKAGKSVDLSGLRKKAHFSDEPPTGKLERTTVTDEDAPLRARALRDG